MVLEELAFKLSNRPGQLARVARILAKAKINLAAISVGSNKNKGYVRLVVNAPARARKLLAEAGYAVEAHDLIAVRLEDKTGSFLKVLDTLAEAKVTADTQAKILPALENAASSLRLKLGEPRASLAKFDVPLAQATTSSLEALQAFTLGERDSKDGDSKAAVARVADGRILGKE